MSRLVSIRNLTLGAVLLGGLALGGSGLVLAQDAEAPPSHPAHIHAGDCATLDPNPAAPLTNVEPRLADDDDEDATDNAPQGILTAAPVLFSDTEDVELAFDDVLAESHAVNVHLSDEEIDTYIACGDIGGVVIDDTLVIALQPQHDSGYSGIAILEKDDDGNIDVEIYLAEPAGDTEPAATPVS
jgi:hypothetical protein